MYVGRECTADTQPIGARLLLADRPRYRTAPLQLAELLNESGPLNSGLDLDCSVLEIEREHAIEVASVEQNTVLEKLLTAHRVPAASDTDAPARRRAKDRFAGIGHTAHLDACPNARRIEPCMNVVHDLRFAVASGRSLGVDLGVGVRG